MYRLIMLDLDGTLADSMAGIVATFNGTLAQAGYMTQPGDLILPLIGLPLAAMFERFIPSGDYGRVGELLEAYRITYDAQAIPSTQLFPTVAETLGRLRGRGLLLTIASSKRRPTCKAMLAQCGIGD